MTLGSLQQLSVDGVILQTLGWNVQTKALTIPARRGGGVSIPGRNGYVPRTNRAVEAGEFALTMWLLGCDQDGIIPTTGTARRNLFNTNFDNLQRVLFRDTGLLNFVQKRPDGTQRQCFAQMTDSVDITTMMARQRAEFTATFQIPDSFWADMDFVTFTGTPGATLPRNFQLTPLAGMTAPVPDAMITVIGPITSPKVTEVETGAWIQYNGTLAAGETWNIESGAWASRKGGGTGVPTDTYSTTYLDTYGVPTSGGTSVLSQTTRSGGPTLMTISTSSGPPVLSNVTTGAMSSGTPPTLQLSGSGSGTATNLSVVARRRWILP
jgi:hypothetical protein